MQIHFLRHATLVLAIEGLYILVDPMLSPAGAMPPVANAADDRRVPLVELPLAEVELEYMLDHIDAVLVTHTHRDHWDDRAAELLLKQLPIICQPEDEDKLRQAGFAAVQPVPARHEWRGVEFQRTGGQHGTGEIGAKMAPVSGFVLRAAGEPALYLAGDTIWCPEVEQALHTYQPDVVIVNAGAAQFLVGDPITMTADDVAQVCHALPTAQVIAVHMEAINHCLLTRAQLSVRLEEQGLASRVLIPGDGALVEL
ncbi:MAG TPA: MBL fold metallo-hydrolase [Roseiflexaceae bacterium]|nr:MBL fold metallo-hydrolase [Roseiflexaceae bacterium]